MSVANAVAKALLPPSPTPSDRSSIFSYVNSDGIYVGASPAFTIMRTSATDHFFLAKDWGSNSFGVGIGFAVGREWRVSDRWRFGAAAQARYAALPSNGDVSTMSEYALSFSATHD